MHIPKGFGRTYFSLQAIQAYVSLLKIFAILSAVSFLDSTPHTLKNNSPPSL